MAPTDRQNRGRGARDIDKPIGVADLHLTRLLPEGFQQSLPTVEAIEAELRDLPDMMSDEE